MNRVPFDTDGLREWADVRLPQNEDRWLLIAVEVWAQLRADLLAAADEIALLMAERVKEKAA